ncbi:hypothetical protein [Escherichia coli]|uniref:hypothetical protein n=1 Tax=Escherichia coli TaxID=562 RepID=UPI001D0C7F8A|nr:hypothetical protein [Escherichia coli]
MKPEKIASLNQRLEVWRNERNKWLCLKMPFIVIFGCAFAAFVRAIMMENELPWYIRAGAALVAIAIPPLVFSYPKKPTQKDVEKDIELRKAFKMDHSVSGDEKGR